MSNFKFEWRMDGEEIGTPENMEETEDEEDVSELLIPMDRPAPVVLEVDDESRMIRTIMIETIM